MSSSYIVSPGTILKEYMASRNISQKDLANITESSERHVSNLINGKVRLTEEYAIKLERVFDDVKAEFWMDLEIAYRLALIRSSNEDVSTLKEISKSFYFDHIFKDMGFSLEVQAEKMLKILGVDSYSRAKSGMQDIKYSFMEDGGDKIAMYVWLKLCEYEIDIQNDLENMPMFSLDSLKSQLSILKDLIYTQDFALAIDNIRRFSNNLGIVFVFQEAVPNAKIRAAVHYIDNRPAIYISNRFKRLDTFYFSFVHEIGHIINDKISSDYQFTAEDDNSELNANSFARNFFLDQKHYQSFIENHPVISAEDILVFSKKNQIIPDILIGFLEHDSLIKHGSFNYMKGKM